MPKKIPAKIIINAYGIVFRFSYDPYATRKRIITHIGILYIVDRLSIYDRNELYYILGNISLYDL